MTCLRKESRKGLTDGLREFTQIDNERALEVGYLNRGVGTFKVRKPKVPEGCSEVTVRENSDELTLRTEEVGTLKTYYQRPLEKERWASPFVDHNWYAFCQALYEGKMYESYKDMSKAVGVKKPQEPQKAKALEKMKAAEEVGEEYYDPTREDNTKGRNETRLALWEEQLKDPIGALDKALKCVERQY